MTFSSQNITLTNRLLCFVRILSSLVYSYISSKSPSNKYTALFCQNCYVVSKYRPQKYTALFCQNISLTNTLLCSVRISPSKIYWLCFIRISPSKIYCSVLSEYPPQKYTALFYQNIPLKIYLCYVSSKYYPHKILLLQTHCYVLSEYPPQKRTAMFCQNIPLTNTLFCFVKILPSLVLVSPCPKVLLQLPQVCLSEMTVSAPAQNPSAKSLQT